jgi:hypothetical protein
VNILSTQPSILQLILCIGCKEIEAITHVIDPIVIGWRAAFCDPTGIGGFDVEDNF